ncbi:hypothetical protein [Bacillus phage SDFMU_Pbc]|uniref:Uncharacterized protein n=1 Tax=Bacillus phage SDFMU_Pbc TaxID=3076135 RepID=A0AA96QY81_9CAUD|nr:hypothetical protein [Bacillus phage SDFMU_Pbc]
MILYNRSKQDFDTEIAVIYLEAPIHRVDVPEWFQMRECEANNLELYSEIPIIEVDEDLFDMLPLMTDSVPLALTEVVDFKAVIEDFGHRSSDFVAICGDQVLVFGVKQSEYSPNVMAVTRVGRVAPELEEKFVSLARKKNIEVHSVDTAGFKVSDFIPLVDVGLTRREKEMKEILMTAMTTLSQSDYSRGAVEYFFHALYPNMHKYQEEVNILTKESMLEDMVSYLVEGWDSQHEEFGDELIKFVDTDLFEEWGELRNINKDVVV